MDWTYTNNEHPAECESEHIMSLIFMQWYRHHKAHKAQQQKQQLPSLLLVMLMMPSPMLPPPPPPIPMSTILRKKFSAMAKARNTNYSIQYRFDIMAFSWTAGFHYYEWTAWNSGNFCCYLYVWARSYKYKLLTIRTSCEWEGNIITIINIICRYYYYSLSYAVWNRYFSFFSSTKLSIELRFSQ